MYLVWLGASPKDRDASRLQRRRDIACFEGIARSDEHKAVRVRKLRLCDHEPSVGKTPILVVNLRQRRQMTGKAKPLSDRG